MDRPVYWQHRLVAGLLLLVAGLPVPILAEERGATALERITHDVRYLTSEELEGRGPGTQGLERAVEFVRQEFKRLGLKSGVPDGSYLQPFPLQLGLQVIREKTHLKLTGPEDTVLVLELGKNFQVFGIGGSGTASGQVVFAGYGIEAPQYNYNDYEGLDVQGKVVIVMRGEPQQDDENSPFDGKRTTQFSYVRTKLETAKKHGAAAVVLVNDPYRVRQDQKDALAPETAFGSRGPEMPVAQVTQDVVNAMLARSPLASAQGEKLSSLEEVEKAIDGSLKPVSGVLAGWQVDLACDFQNQEITVSNVVGVLEGEGPHAQETIIIGAHVDHLGYGGRGSRRPEVREIHNGADDNASGTAALLELARRYSQRSTPPPRRLVFIAFNAEERGLIGSNYYVNNPLFPLEDTIAMVNFDMIGTVRNNELIVYGVGTGDAFAKLVEQISAGQPLNIQAQPGVMAASDHWPFFRKQIPSFHFFSGFTDVYHTPDDDMERLNLEGIVYATDFAERLVDGILALEERPKFQQVEAARRGGPRRGIPRFGIIPNYAGGDEGVVVNQVREDTPAAKAGIQAGDVIVKIGTAPVKNLRDLMEQLRQIQPGAEVPVVLLRGDGTVTVTVKFEAAGSPQRGGGN